MVHCKCEFGYYNSINNCPMRCNTKQSIYYPACWLCKFRVPTTPILRSKQNCNYNLWYCSHFLCSYHPPMWPSLAGGCSYSFVYFWWWVRLAPETYRVNLQNNKLLCVASCWTIINPLKDELNPICHLLALLAAHHILHISRIRVNIDQGCTEP